MTTEHISSFPGCQLSYVIWSWQLNCGVGLHSAGQGGTMEGQWPVTGQRAVCPQVGVAVVM